MSVFDVNMTEVSAILSIFDVSRWSSLHQGMIILDIMCNSNLIVFKLFQGGFVVVTDMIVAIVSIYLNLMVMMAIKAEDQLDMAESLGGGVQLSVLLTNLCSSNIAAAALVKSVAIVQNSYLVASRLTRSQIPFCLLYTITWRATSATLPWSIVLGCWVTLSRALDNIQVINMTDINNQGS